MSRVYLPLSEWRPSSIENVSANSDDCSDQVPLGEIGGCLMSACTPQDEDVYNRAGGATYPPFRPDGSVVQATVRSRRSTLDTSSNEESVPVSVVRLITRTIATFAPWIRGVVPTFAQDLRWNPTKLQSRCLKSLSAQNSSSRVVHLAFHPHLPLLAVALQDNAKHFRVLIYDVCQCKLLPITLTHAFQDAFGIHSVSWKPFSRDVLFIGCGSGVLGWSLSMARQPSAVGQSQVNQPPSVVTSSHVAHQPATFGITDETPACVFYPCTSGGCPVTSMAWSRRNAEYLACASEHSPYLHVHDVTKAPAESSRCALMTLEGGISCAQFAADDSFIVRSVHGRRVLKVTALPSMHEHSISTQTPVDDMVLLESCHDVGRSPSSTSSGTPSSSTFALQFHRTEGVAIVSMHLIDADGISNGGSERGKKRHASSSSGHKRVVMMYFALIATGMSRGIGGEVLCLNASCGRIYIQVSSGHIIVVALPPPAPHGQSTAGHLAGEFSKLLRCVGVLPSAPTGPCCLATFPNFHRGSLLAWSHNGAVHFLPSYHVQH